MKTDIFFHDMQAIPSKGYIPTELFYREEMEKRGGVKIDRIRFMFDTEIFTRVVNHSLCCYLTDNDFEKSFVTTRKSPMFEDNENLYWENDITKEELGSLSFFNKVLHLSLMDVYKDRMEYEQRKKEIPELREDEAKQIYDLFYLCYAFLLSGGIPGNYQGKESKPVFYKDNHGFFCNNMLTDVIASRNVPTRKDTLVLLCHYLMAKEAKVDWLDKVEYLSIYNYNHKRYFYIPIKDIPDKSI